MVEILSHLMDGFAIAFEPLNLALIVTGVTTSSQLSSHVFSDFLVNGAPIATIETSTWGKIKALYKSP